MNPGLRPAVAADLPALLDLLRTAGLPVDDLSTDDMGAFLVAGDPPGGALLAAGALVVYGPEALLRSITVATAVANRGLGTEITLRLVRRAGELGVRRIWLLTTTAADYFPRFGFRRSERGAAPPRISATAEFERLCPGSAVCLVLDTRSA